jgi:tRNA(adenine34) deaminase
MTPNAETDVRWMRRALRLARRAARSGEVPVGAIVVREDKLLGAAANAPIGRHDPSAHAEVLALRRAAAHCGNYRLPGTTLYVTLEPCIMCVGAIVQARVERVVFGASDSRAGAVQTVFQVLDHPALNHRAAWTGGVEAEACAALLQEFFRARR